MSAYHLVGGQRHPGLTSGCRTCRDLHKTLSTHFGPKKTDLLTVALEATMFGFGLGIVEVLVKEAIRTNPDIAHALAFGTDSIKTASKCKGFVEADDKTKKLERGWGNTSVCSRCGVPYAFHLLVGKV
jgi:hypothetical protein